MRMAMSPLYMRIKPIRCLRCASSLELSATVTRMTGPQIGDLFLARAASVAEEDRAATEAQPA